MANTYKAFKVANAALNASGQANPHFKTFDRASNAILLPAYVQEAGVLDIQLSDAQPLQLLSSKKSREKNMKAELHALYLRIDPDYDAFWQRYVRDLGKDPEKLTVLQAGQLIARWKPWSYGQEGLTEKQELYAWGPHSEVRAFDRASINGTVFTVAHQQRKSKYKQDVVMMVTEARGIEVGSVLAFLEHAPAGSLHRSASAASLPECAQIAQVEWFGGTAQSAAASSAALASSSAPAATVVSNKSKSDAQNGNLYFASDLVPANIAVVPRILASGLLSTTQWQVMQARWRRVDNIRSY